ERKFTIRDDSWRSAVKRSELYRQGYLAGNERSSIRVRLAGDKANLNIKSATLGIYRQEYEYDIPVADANKMLDELCEKPIIEKTRHFVSVGEHTWEVDEFYGENEGLIVAEIELKSESEQFELPDWADKEVSDDPRYYNVSLVKNPYRLWPKD
ncbi:MAG: CYTH domain-containing protein, partial [Gammaproteobacteria bacterium]|nr:CYTH domain-containing protein [Gammaproteobacteria bacterium]